MRQLKDIGWGGSSAGRALRSQCRGREFDPPPLHQFTDILRGRGNVAFFVFIVEVVCVYWTQIASKLGKSQFLVRKLGIGEVPVNKPVSIRPVSIRKDSSSFFGERLCW